MYHQTKPSGLVDAQKVILTLKNSFFFLKIDTPRSSCLWSLASVTNKYQIFTGVLFITICSR